MKVKINPKDIEQQREQTVHDGFPSATTVYRKIKEFANLFFTPCFSIPLLYSILLKFLTSLLSPPGNGRKTLAFRRRLQYAPMELKVEYPPPEGGGFKRPCKLPPPEGGGIQGVHATGFSRWWLTFYVSTSSCNFFGMGEVLHLSVMAGSRKQEVSGWIWRNNRSRNLCIDRIFYRCKDCE
jgi:hypothetical protein